MPSTRQYPLSFLGTIRQALQAIEKAGGDPQAVMQRFIDDPAYRKDSINRTRPEVAYMKLGDFLNPEGARRLLRSTFGNEPDFRRVFPSDELTAHERAEMEKWQIRKIMFTRLFSLQQLLSHLDARTASIVIMRFGLETGRGATLLEVAMYHNMTSERARQIESKGLARLRHIDVRATVDPESIESLDLSDRARNCLARAGITTISELVKKTEDDLLNITNFGNRSLDEVKAALAARDLSLKQ